MNEVSMDDVYKFIGKIVLRNEVLESTIVELSKQNKELTEKQKEPKLPENNI